MTLSADSAFSYAPPQNEGHFPALFSVPQKRVKTTNRDDLLWRALVQSIVRYASSSLDLGPIFGNCFLKRMHTGARNKHKSAQHSLSFASSAQVSWLAQAQQASESQVLSLVIQWSLWVNRLAMQSSFWSIQQERSCIMVAGTSAVLMSKSGRSFEPGRGSSAIRSRIMVKVAGVRS